VEIFISDTTVATCDRITITTSFSVTIILL